MRKLLIIFSLFLFARTEAQIDIGIGVQPKPEEINTSDTASPDITAPILDSAEVGRIAYDKIYLFFSENLNEDSVPATFNLDNLSTYPSISEISIGGDTAIITLSDQVTFDDTLALIDYTKPASLTLEDVSSNEAASWTDSSITNYIPESFYLAFYGLDVGQTAQTITSIDRSADTLTITINDTSYYRIIGDSSLAFTDRGLNQSPDTLRRASIGLAVYDSSKLSYFEADEDTLNINVDGWLFEITPAVAPAYCAEFQAWYDELTDPPGTDTANVLNTFVVNAKTHGWWAKGDAVYLLGAKNVTNAKLNIVNPTGDDNCTDPETTNPTFTQWQGILGVGNADYWSTNYNASSEGVNYTQNSATIATYNRTSLSVTNAYIIGATDDSPDLWTGVRPYFGAPASVRAQINDAYGDRYEPTVTGSQGMLIITRTDATVEVTFNKVSQGSTSNASSGIPDLNTFLLARNHEGNDADNINCELFFVFIGGYLTSAERNYMTDDVEVVADYLGKGVIP